MNKDRQTMQVVRNGFNAIKKLFPPNSENPVMTDILIQANPVNGALTFFDDNDNEIFSDTIDKWIDNNSDLFFDEVRNLLQNFIKENLEEISELSIIKPFEFILIDDEKETVCEIYLVDDYLITIDSEILMKDLDKDLDDFIDRLLKE